MMWNEDSLTLRKQEKGRGVEIRHPRWGNRGGRVIFICSQAIKT